MELSRRVVVGGIARKARLGGKLLREFRHLTAFSQFLVLVLFGQLPVCATLNAQESHQLSPTEVVVQMLQAEGAAWTNRHRFLYKNAEDPTARTGTCGTRSSSKHPTDPCSGSSTKMASLCCPKEGRRSTHRLFRESPGGVSTGDPAAERTRHKCRSCFERSPISSCSGPLGSRAIPCG